MLSVVCQARDPRREWDPREDSTVTVHVKVMLNGIGGGSSDYHSRKDRVYPQQPRECDLRKGIDVATWELPFIVDWSAPANQNALIAFRSYADENLGFSLSNHVRRDYPGTRTGVRDPVTGQSDLQILADPGEDPSSIEGFFAR